MARHNIAHQQLVYLTCDSASGTRSHFLTLPNVCTIALLDITKCMHEVCVIFGMHVQTLRQAFLAAARHNSHSVRPKRRRWLSQERRWALVDSGWSESVLKAMAAYPRAPLRPSLCNFPPEMRPQEGGWKADICSSMRACSVFLSISWSSKEKSKVVGHTGSSSGLCREAR